MNFFFIFDDIGLVLLKVSTITLTRWLRQCLPMKGSTSCKGWSQSRDSSRSSRSRLSRSRLRLRSRTPRLSSSLLRLAELRRALLSIMYVRSRRIRISRSSEPRLERRSRTEGALPFSVAVPMGVGVADVDAMLPVAAESLSANIPARLISVDPDGLRSVPLMVDAMLPRCVPSELRGLDPRPDYLINQLIVI